jgi:hypothetical protein
MQDAIGRIYFLARIPGEPTTLQVTCSGLANVIIPSGSLVADTSGNVYSSTSAITIAPNGSATGQFACTANGPIPVPQSVSIYKAVPNWSSVSVASGVEGRNVESRAAFEARRAASVAKNSVGPAPAILGAVLAVAGVLSAYVFTNDTAAPVTVQGVTIPANAVYVAAVGGTSSDVARAIWTKKAPGAPYYAGNTTVSIQDTSPGYNPPYPTYSVIYEVPAGLTIWCAVNIKNSMAVPSNATTLIQNAIIAAFAGTDGGSPATIGGTVFASRFYAGIASLGSWAVIVSLFLGSANSATASFTGSISSSTLTVSSVTGTIAIGQAVVGAGVADGTYITAGSGTSWTVNISQTVGSESMKSIAPALTSVSVNINQIPVVTAADIVVNLV